MKTISHTLLKQPHVYAKTSMYDTTPKIIQHKNSSIANITMSAPGIWEIESRHGNTNTEVISAGIHGNEMAGVYQMNRLLNDIFTGKLEVKKNLLIIIGNLMTLGISRGGNTCGDERDNLNRLFNQGIWSNPKNYEMQRANQITTAINHLVSIPNTL